MEANEPMPSNVHHTNTLALSRQMALVLGGEQVLVGAGCAAYAIDQHVPAVVVYPNEFAGIAEALRLATQAQAAVAPWGGGTQMALGYPLTRLDVVVSLERLNKIHNYDADALTVTAEAGCTMYALNQHLEYGGHMLALDGPHPQRATLGGRIATGGTGLRRGALGSVRELVLGLTVAQSDGTIIKTGGDIARYVIGYDLNKIFVGSLGTLGIIVEATLRLTPIPPHSVTVVSAFADASFIWPLLNGLRAAELRPHSMVVCGPGILGADRGLTASLADQLHPASQSLLIIRLGGERDFIHRQALFIRKSALEYGSTAIHMLRDQSQAPIWETLEAMPGTDELTAHEAVVKVSALPGENGKIVEMARGFCREHELLLGWLADAQTGNVWLRVADDPSQLDHFSAALVALQEVLAWRWRNSIVLGCAPAIKQRLPLWGADPQGLELMRTIKSHFDPAGILNPGRFVGGI